jgi:tRNA(Ile2) C34 agmatinyltransferase TiaS
LLGQTERQDQMKVLKFPRKTRLFPWVSLAYATRNGGPVLKEESSWRDINGIAFYTRKHHVWVLFRRVYEF